MSAHSHSPHDHDHDEAATCCGGDHGHDHGAAHDRAASHGGHGHSHEHLDHPGTYAARATGSPALWATRAWSERAFTVGIGGPVGSGKTALTLKLCEELRAALSLGVCTNDIFTREDAEFLTRKGALPAERIRAVETGGCPHAAIREDVSGNLDALDRAGQESEIPNFKGSYLGRFPLVSADFWTSDHLSERSRHVDACSGTRARGTPTLKRR